MPYIQAGNILDDARGFVGKVQNALSSVQNTAQTTSQAVQNLTKTGKITMVQKVELPTYLKVAVFGGLGLAAYYVFFKRSR